MDFEAKLTRRQRQVAELTVWGASKKEVADKLNLSTRTIENTARAIYQRIGIQKATELCVWWFCKYHGVSFDLSPLKKSITAVFLLLVLLPFEFQDTFRDNECLRTSNARMARRASRGRRSEV